MNQTTNPKNEDAKTEEERNSKPSEEKDSVAKQQQSDPQITELKGLIDPDEPLEVEGTDNPV